MKHCLIQIILVALLGISQGLMASPSIDALLVMPLHEREQIAERFWQKGEYRRAKKQYQIMARLGSKLAQNRLAWMYMNGKGFKKDVVQGWVWSALAAEFNQPAYARDRDEYWKQLSLSEREAAVDKLRDDYQHLSDQAVASHIEVKVRRKIRMDTIAYGLLAEGLVKTWRAEGMIGDPANGNLVNQLKNIHYVSYQHARGERVSLGEFEVLEDSQPTLTVPLQAAPEANTDQAMESEQDQSD